MKNKHLASLLQKDYTTIQVRFAETTKLYTYKYRGGPISKGDHAIVNVADTLKIVRVMVVDKAPRIDVAALYAYKWIIQKVDTSQYDALVAAEEAFMETLQDIGAEKQRASLICDLFDTRIMGVPQDLRLRQAIDMMNSFAVEGERK